MEISFLVVFIVLLEVIAMVVRTLLYLVSPVGRIFTVGVSLIR